MSVNCTYQGGEVEVWLTEVCAQEAAAIPNWDGPGCTANHKHLLVYHARVDERGVLEETDSFSETNMADCY